MPERVLNITGTAHAVADEIVRTVAEHPDWIKGAYSACEAIVEVASSLGSALEATMVAEGKSEQEAASIAAESVLLLATLVATFVSERLGEIIPPCEHPPVARVYIGGAFRVGGEES